MPIFNIHEAKTSLSKLVALAEAGEEIVIARHNIPVVKIVPVGAVVGKGEGPGTVSGFGELAQAEMKDMEQASSVNTDFSPVPAPKKRVPGRFAHLAASLPPDLFLEPLDEDELAAWEGKYSGPSAP
jgi:prevent-host-death family protein